MKIGSMRGVALEVHPALFCLGLLVIPLRSGQELLIAFLSVFAHEWAHVLGAKRRGIDVKSMQLLPTGALAQLDAAFETRPVDEAFIALCGPAMSLALCLCALAGLYLFPLPALKLLAKSNFALFALNLLPALPLDGGRMLRAALAGKFGLRRGGWLPGILGLILGGFLLLIGFCSSVQTEKFHLTYFLLGLSLILGANTCLKDGAVLSARAHLTQKEDLPLCVRRIAADGDTPLSALLSRLWQRGYYEILLIQNGRTKAVFSRQDLVLAASLGARTLLEANALCLRR